MISKDRLLKVIEYLNVHGEQATLEHFKLNTETLSRYKRKALSINEPMDKTEISDEQDNDNRILSARSANITSLDDLLEYSKVDLSVWEVSRHVVNSWEVTNSEGNTYTNYQVKAWLSAKKQESIEDIINSFREKADKYSPVYPNVIIKDKEDGTLLEPSIPDLHLGQLSWGKETGRQNYDVKIAYSLLIDAVEYIIEHTRQFNVDRIVFPIGNDYFNVNSALNTTFAGTPQDEDCRWQKSFTYGLEMAVEAIDRLQAVAPVDVKIIPGNHDYEKSFYLGEVLRAWYRKCNNVNIDNSPITKKYYSYGNTLIGYTHGNKIKADKLPLIMATDVPDLWSKSKYREYHVAHFHHKMEDEFRQVRVITLPSLVPISAWAANAGYDHLREAVANIYDKQRGQIASINYRPE